MSSIFLHANSFLGLKYPQRLRFNQMTVWVWEPVLKCLSSFCLRRRRLYLYPHLILRQLVTIMLPQSKVFNPYITESIFARTFQLYREHQRILFSMPQFQRAKIYFVVERKKVRFSIEEITLHSNAVCDFVFIVADKEVIRVSENLARFTPPQVVEVQFAPEKSTGEFMTFRVWTLSGEIEEVKFFPHGILSELGIDVNDFSKILYIGQSNEIKERSTKHEKLQQVLAEKADDKDIYVYFFQFSERQVEISPLINDFQFVVGDSVTEISSEGKINLVEMSLINYFKPTYNFAYKESYLPTNKQVEKLLRENGYNKIVLEVKHDRIYWNFGSEVVSPKLEHEIIFEL